MQDLFAQAQTRKVYTVSELTRDMRSVLERAFPAAWVEGEVSGYKLHASGHIYFSLKDESAVLKCAFFKSANSDSKFRLEDGMKVICFGRISVYPPRGDYQLYVEKLEPKGMGALQMAFIQLKERLEKEGLFDSAHKRPIPLLPRKIGIVTSPSGAAIRDMLKFLKDEYSIADIVIAAVKVQGEGAAREIAHAIDDFNAYGEVDVLIVGRGGGSLEDLWPFNEEIVARAIYRSKIPAISAVGHEIHYMISDFVADMRVSTPTHAAKHFVENKRDFSARLESIITSYAFGRPQSLVEEREQYVDSRRKDAVAAMSHFLQLEEERFKTLLGKIEAMSPLAILSRGYSITMKMPAMSPVKDARRLQRGDIIYTKLFKGTLVSRVESAD